ncbi:MAG: hypothetical protein H6679_04365 [Epsilonproteobacteria bacterium]|nr:hypothetical protein [Campylobacterota bacterium]
MKITAIWQNLKQLVALDNTLLQLKKDIEQAKHEIANNAQQSEKLEKEAETKKSNIFSKQKEAKLEELTAQTLKEQEIAKREKLDHAHDQKEYKALEKELETITAQRIMQEELLMDKWVQIENETQNLEQSQVKNQQKVVELQQLAQSLEEKLNDLKQQETSITEQRNQARTAVPEEWLVRYDRMKNSVPDPIVPMLNESCSSCYYAIPRQDRAKLRLSGILHCKNCYRFLYCDENHDENEPTTNESTQPTTQEEKL